MFTHHLKITALEYFFLQPLSTHGVISEWMICLWVVHFVEMWRFLLIQRVETCLELFCLHHATPPFDRNHNEATVIWGNFRSFLYITFSSFLAYLKVDIPAICDKNELRYVGNLLTTINWLTYVTIWVFRLVNFKLKFKTFRWRCFDAAAVWCLVIWSDITTQSG